jgi:hypothetical protein
MNLNIIQSHLKISLKISSKFKPERPQGGKSMNDFFTLADQIPIPMAMASVIIATIVASFLVVLVRLLESIPKIAIVAFLMALSGWAMVLQVLQ